MWKKVVAPTIVVSLLWALVSCGTSYILDQLDATQTRLLYQNRNVIHSAGTMQENLWRLQAALLEAAEQLETHGELREKHQGETRRIERTFEDALRLAEQNASTSEESKLIHTIGENFSRYRKMSREQVAGKRVSTARPESIDAAMQLARAVMKPCEELAELAQRLTSEAFQRRDRLRAKVNVARVAFIIIGPAVGILLGLKVARGLHRSISEISVTLRGASGDLEQEIGQVEVYPSPDLEGLPGLQQQVQAVSSRIKQIVEQLQRARREAVRAERLAAVGELAAGVAHEVRNPLTSVKLLIQAIERNQPSGSTDEQRLRIVQQEIARIETTIQELLDYARPPKLHRLRHDVRETLSRALNLVAGRAQQNHVSIEERLRGQETIVDADPNQLHQVFINLLLNAIEAMPSGGALLVSLEDPAMPSQNANRRESGGRLRIVFHDTGPGIASRIMPRLFEPFVTSKECGIGLGLAISRQIMQEHGGNLTGCNAASGGATFIVELPSVGDAAPRLPSEYDASTSALIDANREISRAETVKVAGH